MDQLTKTVKVQMVVFAVIALAALVTVGIGYVGLPAMLFGVGKYTVTVQLPESGNLYPMGNVSYRGSTVGRIESVTLTDTGVEATLNLDSDVAIPADLDAEVHSQTAIGEQYVALLPRTGGGPKLRDGDVIPIGRTTVPPNLNALLDATNRGLQAIPNDNVRTLIDESYTAFGGLGPDISRFVNASTKLAIAANKNIDGLTALIDNAGPVLDSQADSADSIQAWAGHLATITGGLQREDDAVAGVLANGGGAVEEARALIDRIKPSLPVMLANLVTLEEVAITYQPNIEQLLVLLPQGIANLQGTEVANHNTKTPYPGIFLSFNLNINLPPPCTTGFLPAQQKRTPVATDAPERPAGDVYCRRPQDSIWNVRGARNTPCVTRPGKRAATVKMCESDEQYVPLNDGMNWKGDPNATLSGQEVPELPPGTPPPVAAPAAAMAPGPGGLPPQMQIPAMAAAMYDPATGTYVAPDGNTYVQSNLAQAHTDKSWQSLLLPPTG